MNDNADLLKQLRIDRAAPPPTSRRPLWIALGVAAVVVVVALAAWGLLGRGRAVTVHTAEAVAIGNGSGNATVLDATGYVVARRMATVSAKITGKVREVLIEEGQHVQAGQVMATLDPIDANAARALATSQASAARSQIGSVQAQLRDADAEATRLGGLVKQQLVSRSQYDQAVAQRDALRAQLATAQHNAGVASDNLRIADIGVDNTIVRAPFAGVVVAKAAQPGEIVSPFSAGGGFTRTGIGTVVDMDSLEVEVDVGEAFIGRVQPDMPVEAVLNAYPDWRIPGHVIAIIPTADRSKATVKVRVAFNVRDPRIVPDMGVRVSFLEKTTPTPSTRKPGVLVPAGAVATRGGKPVAFVVTGLQDDTGRAQQRGLTVGRTIGDDKEVLDGLAGGDTVVVDPPETLADGARVRVAPAEADTSSDDNP